MILANTSWRAAPLVPEIRLRLLCDNSPLWQAFSDEKDQPEAPAAGSPSRPGVPWLARRPYWAFAWGGGQALARYVLDHPDLVRAKRVLDFGAGCGLAGIAAAMAGAAGVTASDVDALAIQAIACNARANGVDVHTLCTDLIYTENRGWDVVLAGDPWYDSRLARHGLRWFRALAADGVVVLVADPGRTYSPSAGMEWLASYPCRTVPDLEHPNLQTVSVSVLAAR
ncbi:MAG: methyltransferase [Kiritimatiellae bacterium]|nr:methyltransferase [Kiritimatiellia bacterium]